MGRHDQPDGFERCGPRLHEVADDRVGIEQRRIGQSESHQVQPGAARGQARAEQRFITAG